MGSFLRDTCAVKLRAAERVSTVLCICEQSWTADMNAINLILTICSVMSPNICEETNLVFSASFSLRQCAMAAPPYIAQWAGEHPKWTAVKWRCEYPHSRDKAEAGFPPRMG
jgi:hypothetical protein